MTYLFNDLEEFSLSLYDGIFSFLISVGTLGLAPLSTLICEKWYTWVVMRASHNTREALNVSLPPPPPYLRRRIHVRFDRRNM